MKITRKLQRQVEIKIRHAIATGKLPVIERSSAPDPDPKLTDGNGGSQSR